MWANLTIFFILIFIFFSLMIRKNKLKNSGSKVFTFLQWITCSMQQFKHIQVKWVKKRKKMNNKLTASSWLSGVSRLMIPSRRETEVLEEILSVNQCTLQFPPLQRSVKWSCSCWCDYAYNNNHQSPHLSMPLEIFIC